MRDDKLYAPTGDDFLVLSASTGLLLSGIGWLVAIPFVRRRQPAGSAEATPMIKASLKSL